MIVRLLFLFLLFYLFFTLLNLYLFSRKRRRNFRERGEAARGEEMVLDPQCRVYLPKSEATLQGGHYFCSEQCARLYLAARSS